MPLHSPALLKKTIEPFLSYRNGNPAGPVEASPIPWNGEVIIITGNSLNGNYQGTFRIDKGLWDDRPFVTVAAPGMQYLCAIEDGGTIHVFGTDSTHKKISRMTSTDLINWTAPVVVFTAPAGHSYYNTSVCKKLDGTFLMAAETKDTAFPAIPFVTRFLASANLSTWALIPGLYNNGVFTNCPTIRQNAIDGKYYILYMSNSNGGHYTFISRSVDLLTWQISTGLADGVTIPFAPAANEGNNNSDVDMCDFNGETYFVYARGDQNAWLELATARYPATSDVFLKSFFTT